MATLIKGRRVVSESSPSRNDKIVRLEPGDDPAAVALEGVTRVEINFPKFGDGRGFSIARLLRGRYGYTGELRAVGDVLREQAGFMVRCGFDAFEPADGSTPEDWERAAHRFRHAYQRSTDRRTPAFVERGE